LYTCTSRMCTVAWICGSCCEVAGRRPRRKPSLRPALQPAPTSVAVVGLKLAMQSFEQAQTARVQHKLVHAADVQDLGGEGVAGHDAATTVRRRHQGERRNKAGAGGVPTVTAALDAAAMDICAPPWIMQAHTDVDGSRRSTTSPVLGHGREWDQPRRRLRRQVGPTPDPGSAARGRPPLMSAAAPTVEIDASMFGPSAFVVRPQPAELAATLGTKDFLGGHSVGNGRLVNRAVKRGPAPHATAVPDFHGRFNIPAHATR
jgi:hypothetical protein